MRSSGIVIVRVVVVDPKKLLWLGYKISYMKKILSFYAVAVLMLGCASGDKKADETKTDSHVGVQNANGNVPDTTNAIKLSTDTKDSSAAAKDSIK